MNQTLHLKAAENFRWLQTNPYPGRGLILGQTNTHLIQVCWIMGRSENSRNRVYTEPSPGKLITEPADPSKVVDPSLIIYTAMDQISGSFGRFVVSNGSQTDDVVAAYRRSAPPLLSALSERTYEPDAPNFTPRITGMCTLAGTSPRFEFVILRKALHDDSREQLHFVYPSMEPEYGRCITTYTGDAEPGQPLPAFEDVPLLVPLGENAEHTLCLFGDHLDEKNLIAIAVKEIDIQTGSTRIFIRNKRKKLQFAET